jgi:hypothetical protein
MEGHAMSRVVTPPQAPSAGTAAKLPHDKVAMRAYDKWCKRGQPTGTAESDWLEAEAELRSELTRGNLGGTARR